VLDTPATCWQHQVAAASAANATPGPITSTTTSTPAHPTALTALPRSPSSPLYHLTLNDIEAKDMELVVFMDGIDAMTSNNMSARYSYYFSDLRLNHTFSTIYLRATRKGKVGLDLSEFDATLPSGEWAAAALWCCVCVCGGGPGAGL
jgi:hypothetical protein